jgi:hypothetical protein
LPRLAEQQVNMLGHDDIAVDVKSETTSHTLQPGLEYMLGNRRRERWTAMVTTEGYEVSLPRRVKSFQSPRHNFSLRPQKCPTQAKERLEWATRLSPGFFRVSFVGIVVGLFLHRPAGVGDEAGRLSNQASWWTV